MLLPYVTLTVIPDFLHISLFYPHFSHSQYDKIPGLTGFNPQAPIKVTAAGENCSWTRISSIVLRHRLSRRLISPKQIFDWSREN